MQHIPFSYFCNLLSNNVFTPPNTQLKDMSGTSTLLLVYTTSADLTSIEYVHIGLIVHWAKSPLYKAKSIPVYIKYIEEDSKCISQKLTAKGSAPKVCSYCMFLYNFDGVMATQTDPPYCLVYPITYQSSIP